MTKMNERIKYLATLSTKEVWSDNPYNGAPEFEGYELDVEKFAELIVRECMNVARQQRNPANLNYKPSERFVEDLQKHFGVE